MKKSNEKILKKEVKHAKYEDLKICCPPMSKSLLKDLIDPKPINDVNDDYRLTFDSMQYYQDLFQAYLDYIVLVHPCVEKLVTHWKLSDSGSGTNPAAGIGTLIEEHWNWFTPSGNGLLSGTTNFFNTVLVENKWYHIHIGIYTESCDAFNNKNCKVDFGFHYRWQVL